MTTLTRAAVLSSIGGRFEIEELELAPPRAGEVQVKLEACGVCASDDHLVSGATEHPLPVVPGHEGAGRVEALGAGVTGLALGDRVILSWAPSCAGCPQCDAGRPARCTRHVKAIWSGELPGGGTRFSRKSGQPVAHFSALGAFSERIVVAEDCCIKSDPAVPATIAALIGCAVTTGVGAALNTAPVRPGQSVLVYGVGGVGLSVVMGARLAGAARIVVVDLSEEKCAAAKALGATVALVKPSVAELRAAFEGAPIETVFDTTGVEALQQEAIRVASPGGTVVLVGLSDKHSGPKIPAARLIRTEKTVTGCFYGSAAPAREFPRLEGLYRAGRLPLDELVTRTYRLDEINEGFEALRSGAVGRGVVLFDP
jgi:S-(hydroxymethyl)glutathione dehydrogenase / alcohol dehydrogenase